MSDLKSDVVGEKHGRKLHTIDVHGSTNLVHIDKLEIGIDTQETLSHFDPGKQKTKQSDIVKFYQISSDIQTKLPLLDTVVRAVQCLHP
ncbi:hypothetical protein DPMN_113928 [Dreissena polymorpha]|uniref:Uncharacterized protein n=1 Tax=Dreissena polymorpha TaxID=45954 RepID=A0A9D4QR95_DREPO|nr:hypothetical protein DPMN_113928 [Dreissena polymorpha]